VLQRALPGVAPRNAPVEACRLPHGGIRELALSAHLAPGRAIGGDWIASTGYVDSWCYGHDDAYHTAVSLTSVAGERSAIWDVGGDLGALGVTVRRVVVGADGLAAIVVRLRPESCGGQAKGSTDVVGVIEGRTGTHQILDRGHIPASTLRLNGRRVSWTRDGSPQVAQISAHQS
jgi:hypothetical protein